MYVVAHNGAHLFGGAERATVNLLAGLRARGHRVLLFCADPLVAERTEAFGVPAERAVLGGDVMLPHALRFAVQLRRHRPDALVVGTFKKMLLASLAARLARVPRVVARIGLETDTPRGRKYTVAIDRWMDTVVLKTEDMRRKYLDAGVEPAKLAVIPGGIAARPRLLPPGQVRRSLGLTPETRVVGAVARLDVQKRFDRLLDAFVRLPADVHCILAGEGPDRARLEGLIAERGVGDRVHLLGHREEVGDVLDALDLYLISSDREGMSNSMMEALVAGVPVVSTAVSGAADALEPFADGGAPGAVVGFDAAEIAAAARPFLASPDLRARARAAALRRGREEFDFARMVERWEALLAGRGAAGAG